MEGWRGWKILHGMKRKRERDREEDEGGAVTFWVRNLLLLPSWFFVNSLSRVSECDPFDRFLLLSLSLFPFTRKNIYMYQIIALWKSIICRLLDMSGTSALLSYPHDLVSNTVSLLITCLDDPYSFWPPLDMSSSFVKRSFSSQWTWFSLWHTLLRKNPPILFMFSHWSMVKGSGNWV